PTFFGSSRRHGRPAPVLEEPIREPWRREHESEQIAEIEQQAHRDVQQGRRSGQKRVILAAIAPPRAAGRCRAAPARHPATPGGAGSARAQRPNAVDGEALRLAVEAPNPVDDEIGPHRTRDEEPLRGIAAERRDGPKRVAAVDTLRDDAHLERPRQLDDDAHDLLVLVVRRGGRYEALVDLDLGGRNLLEVAERRVALAEIVDREADAELADAFEARHDGRVAGDEALLGQLDDE